jgi:hypothetical protein
MDAEAANVLDSEPGILDLSRLKRGRISGEDPTARIEAKTHDDIGC